MKRILGMLLACTMVFALAGCSNGSTTTSQTSETGSNLSEPLSQPEESGTESTVQANETGETDSEEGSVLVAYFSWSGNTETVANLIA